MYPIRVEIKTLVQLALPVLAAQLLLASTSFVDTLMSGQAGTEDLAGVGIGSSLWSVCAMFLLGAFMAINPAVAQHGSRGEYQQIANYVQQGFWLSVPVVVVLIGLFNGNQYYLPLLIEDHQVLMIASGYLDGLSWGMPAIIGFFVLKPFSEGMAYTQAQTISAAVGLVVNVPANYVLIFGKLGFPELGGAGCGWATAISFWAMFGTLLYYTRYHSAFKPVPFYKRIYLPDWQKISFLVKVGLPIALAITIEGSAFALVTLFIAGLPAEEIAAHQIAMNISYLAYMVPFSMSTAITIRVATYVGVESWGQARQVLKAGVLMALVAGLLLALAIFVFRGTLADLYSNDQKVIGMASVLLLFSMGFKIFDSIAAPLQGALRGYHDVNMTLLASVVAYWLICLPMGYVLGLTDWVAPAMGAKGFWISLVVGVGTSAVLLVFRYRQVSWAHFKVSPN
ncbi:MAG: MATE family efflux transporter [Pseudomonadales bacterium]|nr:MATE family efflux transporter [Pseudomonadales bacterium]